VDVAVETAYHQPVGYTTREVISAELIFIVLKPKQLIIIIYFLLFLPKFTIISHSFSCRNIKRHVSCNLFWQAKITACLALVVGRTYSCILGRKLVLLVVNYFL
jgi:hypothetical protein